MGNVARISMSLEESLLEQFDGYVAENGYPTRSEAMKGLMHKALVDQEWQKGTDVAGTISIVYDHHKRGAMEKLVSVQHDFGRLIVCTQHVHLDHNNCMEVIVVRGKSGELKELLSHMKSIKGIKHSALMVAS